MKSRLSLRLFSIAGIPVLVHWTLPVFLVAMVLLTPRFVEPEVMKALLVFGSVLCASVLAHELGHCVAARRTGGEAHAITLWPLGGYAEVDHPHSTGAELTVNLAGIAVNLLLAAIAGGLHVAMGRGAPGLPSLTPVGDVLTCVWGLNLALAILNLLPGYPLDGGRALETYLSPRLGRNRAAMIALVGGVVLGIGLTLFGLGTDEYLLTIVGIFGLSECGRRYQEMRQQPAQDERFLGQYDFSQGYSSLEDNQPAPPKKVRVRTRVEAAAHEEEPVEPPFERPEREVARERLDHLLDRIAADGIGSLSADERAFLDAESERLRARREG